MLSTEILNDYQHLTTRSAFVSMHGWSIIRVTGVDRKRFLHSFCTAEVKEMAELETVEAFVLDGKGKTIGHVFLFNDTNEIVMFGVGEQVDRLIQHLDMYVIRDDVQLIDVSSDSKLIFVTGPNVPHDFSQLSERMRLRLASRVELAGIGQVIVCPDADAHDIEQGLNSIGIPEASVDALDVVRVENATPWFRLDFDDSNLPQELCRDEKAISFDKGCYLGQETVARIDALGRVNKLICTLKFNGETADTVPRDVVEDGKTIGRISSVVFSPKHAAWIGLAILKRSFAEGKSLLVDTNATVVL